MHPAEEQILSRWQLNDSTCTLQGSRCRRNRIQICQQLGPALKLLLTQFLLNSLGKTQFATCGFCDMNSQLCEYIVITTVQQKMEMFVEIRNPY